MFKVKEIDIDAAHEFVVLLLEEDAKELSHMSGEKVKISCQKTGKFVICQLEIVEHHIKHSKLPLKRGEIGLFMGVFERLETWEGQRVNILPAEKPKSLEYIKAKFGGRRLKEEEFAEIIKDIVDNKYSEIETTYFVLSCMMHKLGQKETIGLTKAMVGVGKVLDFKQISTDIIVDKHCIGGVPGNRTTMIVVPIIAAAGLTIPKTSSRSITSPAGTADTMEVFANVQIELTKMYKIVKEKKGCIVWGGALDLSPADDIIIQIEHPLELDSEGQMIASILSKKKSAGSTHVLIDIPVGLTAKVKTLRHGKSLKRKFERIGKAVGLEIHVIITDGSQPIGSGIGPLHEAVDVLNVLKNDSLTSLDLKEKSLMMAGKILEIAGVTKKGEGYDLAEEILVSGKALEKFEEIIDIQGRNNKLPKPKYSLSIKAKLSGKVLSVDNKQISEVAFILGAPQDKAAGLVIMKKVGNSVKEGDVLFEMYSNSELKLKYGFHFAEEKKIFSIR